MYIFNQTQHLFDYYCFNNNLDNSTITNIFNLISDFPFERGNTESDKNKLTRYSQIKWIDYTEETVFLYNLLCTIINKANQDHYNFNIVNSEDLIQYTEYYSYENGKYGWHMDSHGHTKPPYRKLSLTIQLSDPNEYEGGDLEIWEPHPVNSKIYKVPKEKGKIIVFPSHVWHQVTPVTKGVRKSLVWWVGGSQWK